jgi:hypothetical protein
MTRSGRFSPDWSSVMESDDVLEASRALAETLSSISPSTLRFTSMSSTTASMTRPHLSNPSIPVVAVMAAMSFTTSRRFLRRFFSREA